VCASSRSTPVPTLDPGPEQVKRAATIGGGHAARAARRVAGAGRMGRGAAQRAAATTPVEHATPVPPMPQ
jgi:hypothetical protein